MVLVSQRIASLVSLLITVVFLTTTTFSQSREKVIEWSKSPIGSNNERTSASLELSKQIEVIEVVDFVVGSQSIIAGKSFASDDDWLRNLTVRVRNVSNQRIARVQMTIVLPELGISPDIPFCYGCSPAEKEKGIMPGETVELGMPGGGFYEWVKNRIADKKLSLSQITKAEIHHWYVTLPSGPTLFSGCVKTTDSKNACPVGSK